MNVAGAKPKALKKLVGPVSPHTSNAPSKDAASAQAPSAQADGAKPVDVALISGRTEDGKGMRIIRARNDQIELGDLRPLEAGKPIHGEVVRLTPRREFPLLCDVEVAFASKTDEQPSPSARAPRRRKGPAQVASDQYRNNYDQIWSAPAKKAALPN
jgi:hypothetical protein